MKKQIAMMFVLGLSFCVSVGFAEEPAKPQAVPAVVTAESSGECDAPADVPLFDPLFAPVFAADGGKGAESVCIADCQHGSDKVCTGSFCFAVDQNCPNTRGYCYGSDTGYRYCNKCPEPCSVQASCSGAGGGTVSCSGTNNDCFAIDNCYAYCNGTYHWCPNPGLCPV